MDAVPHNKVHKTLCSPYFEGQLDFCVLLGKSQQQWLQVPPIWSEQVHLLPLVQQEDVKEKSKAVNLIAALQEPTTPSNSNTTSL